MLNNFVTNLINKKNDQIDFSSVNPIGDYSDGYAIMKNGDIVYLYEIELSEEESLNKNDYLEFIKRTSVILNGQSPGDFIQRLDVYYELPQENTEKHRTHQNRFIKKIASHFEGRAVVFEKNFLCVGFSRALVKKTPTGTDFSNLSGKKSKNPYTNLSERLKIAADKIVGISSQLESIFPKVKMLSKKEIETFYFQYFNLDFSREHDSLLKQHNNGFSSYTVGEKKLNIVTLSERPSEFSTSVTDKFGVETPFIGSLTSRLQFPHILSQTIRLRNTATELKKLDNERKRIETSDQADKITIQQISDFTEKARLENLPIVDFSLQVLLYDIDDARRENAIIEVENRFKNLNSAVSSTETSEDIGNLYFANVPGNMNNNYRWLYPMLSSQALACMNYATTFKGDEEGDYVCNRDRRLIKMNFSSEEDLNNQHAIILGPSGSGKSVLMAMLIGQRHARREKQIIIDSGGTYKNLVGLLGGEYYEYSEDTPLKTNPFLIPQIDGKYNLTEEKIFYLLDFIVTAWKGDHKPKEVEMAILRKWIVAYYEAVNQKSILPSLKNFLPWLKVFLTENSTDEEITKDLKYFDFDEYYRIMEQYTIGIYETAINAEDIEDIGSNDLICFDLKEIKENAKLYPLVTKQIIELTKDFTKQYEHIRKWLYLEEAWTSLEDKIGEMVSMLYRTWRKYKGAVYTITQGIREIQESSVGFTMLDNSDVRFILNHKGKDENELQDLIKALGLTELDVEKLLNLRKEKYFRDNLIKRLDRTDIIVAELPIYVYAATSSREKERNLLRDMYKFYGSMEHAVNQFVEIKENA